MKNDTNRLIKLEKVLEYDFNNKDLLLTALTHSSYCNEKKEALYNERLEFLGDSVLQLSISEYLFINNKDKSEGELTKIRSLIVCETSLHNIAVKWKLGSYIFMSKGEELTGGRNRVSILADCVEAIIAAIYLDSRLDSVKRFIYKNFSETIKKAINNEIVLDYKTRLQEILQQHGDISIVYNLIKFEGPPHRRKFYTEVLVDGDVKGEGSGFSKKESEQLAAKAALAILEVSHE